MVIADSRLSSNTMSTNVSPHKPTRVWKPPKSTDGSTGVPSMFAHTTLSKPLKVNKAVTSTICRRSAATDDSRVPISKTFAQKPAQPSKAKSVPVSTLRPKTYEAPASTRAVAAAAPSKDSTSVPLQSEEKATKKSGQTPSSNQGVQKGADCQRSKVNRSHSGKVKKMVVAKPKKTQPTSATASSGSTPEKDGDVAHATVIRGGGLSVAGTPQSWPKPHAVPSSCQHHSHTPKITRFSKPKKRLTNSSAGSTLDNIDELIPEMYRKSKTSQPDPELQLKMDFLRALREYEQAQEEEKLKYQPIQNDIDAALNALKNAKRQNEDIDALLEDETSSLRSSMHSIREKLAFFTSNHSISASSSSSTSSDDSSVSSWGSSDSEHDDGLFRG